MPSCTSSASTRAARRSDLEKLDEALEVNEADIEWLNLSTSTPESLQGLPGGRGADLCLQLTAGAYRCSARPETRVCPASPRKSCRILRSESTGSSPSWSMSTTPRRLSLSSWNRCRRPQSCQCDGCLAHYETDSDDLRANIPEGIGDYVDLLPEVAARFDVTPDELDTVVYEMTGGCSKVG